MIFDSFTGVHGGLGQVSVENRMADGSSAKVDGFSGVRAEILLALSLFGDLRGDALAGL